jgi:hypothetical protein
MSCPIFWILCRLAHFWSYANTIETAVLVAIIYDIYWHRNNIKKDIERDEASEARAIEREAALEKRQIQRERRESIRRLWQELQSNLISLSRVASIIPQHRKYILENHDSLNPSVQRAVQMMAKGMPSLFAELDDRWGRVVAQINVMPEPKDALALEIIPVIRELEKTVGHKEIEITEATQSALAKFVTRVADKGTLPNLDD